jgi:hypothetical protein
MLSPYEEEHLRKGRVTVERKPENTSGINLNFDTLRSPQNLVIGPTGQTVIDLNVAGFSSLPGSNIFQNNHPNSANSGQAGAPLSPIGPGAR